MEKAKGIKYARVILGVFLLTIFLVLLFPKSQEKNELNQNQSATPNTPTTHTVILTPKGFLPQKIAIKKGEVVVWENKSGKDATVNSANHPTHKLFPVLNLGSFSNGETSQARIYRIGELQYHNDFNPEQTGTILVKE